MLPNLALLCIQDTEDVLTVDQCAMPPLTPIGAIGDDKAIVGDKRDWVEESTDEGRVPVPPEEVIEAFSDEFKKVLKKIKEYDLQASHKEALETSSALRDPPRLARTRELLREERNRRAAYEAESGEIMQRANYYNSKEGKDAREKDPSLKMTKEQRIAVTKRSFELDQKIETQEGLIKSMRLRVKDLENKTRLLQDVLNKYKDAFWDFNKNVLRELLKHFKSSSDVWFEAGFQFNDDFDFRIDVGSYPHQAGSVFELTGARWMDDLIFQRRLMSLFRENGGETRQTNLGQSAGAGLVITAHYRNEDENKFALLELAYSVRVANMIVRARYKDRVVADGPSKSPVTSQRLVGWDVDMGLDQTPLAFIEVFNKLAKLSKGQGRVGCFVSNLISRVVNSGKGGGYTRKLAILIQPGDMGAKARIAKHSCIEFGLGGQSCVSITWVLTNIRSLSPEFFTYLYPKHIKRDTVAAFHSDESKVGIIGWGHHSRVIFKVDGGSAVVDPWKLAENVRRPGEIREAFGAPPEWIEREPEQCGESSCSIVAMIRAIILAIAAKEGEDLRKAARSDIADVAWHGPLAIMLVRCVHYLAQGRTSSMPPQELFATDCERGV